MKRGHLFVLAILIVAFCVSAVSAASWEETNMTVYIINSAPNITDANVTPNPAEPEDTLYLWANVTDVNGIPGDFGTVLVSLYNGTTVYATVPMEYNATSGRYENRTYTLPITVRPFGEHNATFNATDQFGLWDSFIVAFNVTDNTAPLVYYVNADPLNVDPGNAVSITANVSDNVETNTVWVEINGTNYTMTLYAGDDSDGAYYYDGFDTLLPAGQYNFTVYANDTFGNLAFNDTGFFNINALVSLTLNNTPIDFGNTTIPVTDRKADNGTAVPVDGYDGDGLIEGFPLNVSNTGNVNINLSISGTNLTGLSNGAYEIPVNAVAYNTTTTPGNLLSLVDTEFATNVPGLGDWTPLYFWISIPEGYISQFYQGTVNISAVQS